MPASSSGGRRAAQASADPMENDQIERDASLRRVEARDLVEFGMIPVSERVAGSWSQDKLIIFFVSFAYFDTGICRTLPRIGPIPQPRR